MGEMVVMILTEGDGTITLGESTLTYVVPKEESEAWLSKYNSGLARARGYKWVAYRTHVQSGA